MNRIIFFTALFILVGFTLCNGQVANANGHRLIMNLDSSWEFRFAYDVNTKPVKSIVNLPHTWDIGTSTDGKLNYDREAGIYEKKLYVPSSWKNKRLFLYFEGANSVASVFVNKHFVSEHRGGYTAFCLEISNLVIPGHNNDISVQVSNAYRLDVLPLAGDFNVYGGIHRPVSLIITSKGCISPLDYASPGVYLKQRHVSEKMAKVGIMTQLSLPHRAGFSVRTIVTDSNNKVAATVMTSLKTYNSKTLQQDIVVKSPHLWNGKTDPYLYQVRVQLLESGKIVDEVDQPLGLRFFKVDANKGFFLNGKHLDLHGVGLHEDVAGKGSALGKTDYDKDMGLIKEIGATALRLTHYPHNNYFYNLCDRNGLVVWSEIPLVGPGGYTGAGYIKSPALEQQAQQVLIEMIRQNYNHPSVCFWGLFNELKLDYDDPISFLKVLNKIAKKEDPSRLTTCATFLDNDKFNQVSNLIAWNKYYGWYDGEFKQMGVWADRMHHEFPQKPIAVSEYGAGGSPFKHTEHLEKPAANSQFHPEEWQTLYHENNWQQLQARPFIWAKFVWALADFGSSVRTEGDMPGINDKGLVSYDREVKKDAFYFYKANWSNEPLLYITDRRNNMRSEPVTTIKVYTTMKKVQLVVNGMVAAQGTPDQYHTISWGNISLHEGKNRIEVKGQSGNVALVDICEWTLTR